MHMKRVTFIFALVVLCLGLPSLMRAEDNAMVGTWKLNLEKSKYAEGMAPKALMRTISADGDSVKYVFEGTAADGSEVKFSFTVKYDGKDYDVSGKGAPAGADHITLKKLNSHMTQGTLKKGDKVVANVTTTVSHDGKTATVQSKYTDDKGKVTHVTQVYDKQ
jgi:hypothetical protein